MAEMLSANVVAVKVLRTLIGKTARPTHDPFLMMERVGGELIKK